MSANAGAVPPPATPAARPLFGGYALVAVCGAWLAGIALRAVGGLAALPAWAWLALAGGWAALGVAVAMTTRGMSAGWARSAPTAVGGARRPAAGHNSGRLPSLALAAAVLGAALALGAARAAWADTAGDPRSVAALPHGVTLELRGDVAAEPILEANGRLLVVEVGGASRDGGAVWRPATGRVELHVGGPDDWFTPGYGDTLQLKGKLAPVDQGAPVGVLARMVAPQVTITARGGGNPLLAWLFALRVRLAAAIQRSLPEPEAALLIGILLGLKTPVLRARLALFTTTGTIHLVVPAGLKVSLLADVARRVAAPLGRWPGTGAALVAVAGYAALGGGGPAAVRAAIMGGLLALAPALGRRYDVYAALALAALLMTAVEPLLVYDAGFQLTTLATLGIPLFAPTISGWLLWPLARVRAGALLAPVAELLAVTVAAQLATLPVVALSFGLISLVAPLANLLAVPLLAPLLLLGIALAAAALAAPALALPVAWATWPLLWLTDRAIELSAGLPAASVAVPGAPTWPAWGYYAALAAALVAIWRVRRARPAGAARGGSGAGRHGGGSGAAPEWASGRWALAGLALVTLLTAGGAAAPALATPVSRLDFLDVGPGGAATLLRLADGATALIDGGPSGPTLEQALAGRLPFWQRSLDLAMLTDPRAGAETGLQDAAEHYAVGQAVDAGMLHPTPTYVAWLDALARAGTPHARVRQGDVIRLGATTLRALAPPQTLFAAGGGSTATSDDLIVRLDTPGLRVLLLGEADAYALDALAFAGEPLAADVVEVALPPGTGLDLSGPLGAVLLAAHPRLVVIAQGAAPARPGKAVAAGQDGIWPPDAAQAQALGATIARVSATGTVSLQQRADGGWDLLGA